MEASPLTYGVVFSIDELLRAGADGAAAHLVRVVGLSYTDEVDRAVIQQMKNEESIRPSTVTFIRKHGARPTPAARRKAVQK